MAKPLYVSLSGLPFQTPGSEDETATNIAAAMAVLRRYALTTAGEDEAMVALACVEDEFPLTEPLCDQMRIAFLWDDQDPGNTKRHLARRA